MYSIIRQNVITFFFLYIQQAGIAGLLIFVTFWLIYIIYWKCYKKQTFTFRFLLCKSALYMVFAMYAYFVIGITLLSRQEGYSKIINLRPFSTFGLNYWDRVFIYENVLLFVPYGILGFLIWKRCRRPVFAILLGAFSSLIIEIAQLITHRGRFELDDILTNTIGMFLGWLLIRLLWNKIRKSNLAIV